MSRILLIKHGSLGDIIFSLPVMNSIFIHKKNIKIDLLTEDRYIKFLTKTNFFKKFLIDNRTNNLFITIILLIKILGNKYDLIIDLQNSKRTSYYNLFFRLFSNVKICSSRKFSHIRYYIPEQGSESTTEGLFNQIKLINIPRYENSNYDWLKIDLDKIYHNKIVLFIPGTSKKGAYKQWQANKFAELASYCENKNYYICLIGTKADTLSVLPIIKNCKKIINNIDNSPPNKIFSIAKLSKLIVTNDTGPGHIAALSGSNILWIVNNNKITKANIGNRSYNFKVTAANVKDIKTKNVIKYIENKNLL